MTPGEVTRLLQSVHGIEARMDALVGLLSRLVALLDQPVREQQRRAS